MVKELHPEITQALRDALEKLDLDGLAYRLSQVVVEKRNQADKGSNPGEKKYWQEAVTLALEFAGRVEGI